jgi:hypothetical protein
VSKRTLHLSDYLLVLLLVVMFAGCGRETAIEDPGDKPSAAKRSLAKLEKERRKKEEKVAGKEPSKNKKRGLSQEEMREQMEAIGYLAESDIDAGGVTGVTVFDPERAQAGLSLYVSAHAAEAYLIEMDGTEIHRWHYDFEQVWPDFQPPRWQRPQTMEHFRRVHMYPNGDLLAIFSYVGMIKLDRDSNLLWAFEGNSHHDMHVTEDGTIYVLGVDPVVELRGDKEIWTLRPTICVLDPDGKEVRRIQTLDYFENSMHRPLLNAMQKTGDLLHFNSIEVFDGSLADRSDLYQKGNILISSRKLSFIAILDPEKEEVVWTLSGMWRGQHEATLLDNGNMLIFDNRRFDGRSQVLEFEPFTQEIVWSYSGTDDKPLWTGACGIAERLANGNTLATETHGARALEIAPNGTVVWEFVNPHVVAGGDKGKIANIYTLNRLPSDWRPGWIEIGPSVSTSESTAT